ncbi:MAG: efflux RND transporter periplasmic adaptor subunit [Desulfohalobiaceae bacterium]
MKQQQPFRQYLLGMCWLVWALSLGLPALSLSQEPGSDAVCQRVPLALSYELKSIETTQHYQAVGSIQPLRKTRISSLVQARVQKVLVRPGDQVHPGQELVILDDREFKSRLKQSRQELQAAQAARQGAKQEVQAAQARLQEAEPDYRRLSSLQAQDMASQQDLDRARSAFLQAKAGLEQAKMGLQEAEAREQLLQERIFELSVQLDYTRIQAQEQAEVVQRMVEPGDTAAPGKALLSLQSRDLRMEARVPEGLLQQVTPDREYTVHVDPLQQDFQARLTEIEPAADPGSRSFLVKLQIKQPGQDLYPGMFARLLLDLGQREQLLLPIAALRHVGQLPIVEVLENGRAKTRHVRLGQRIGGCVEVLSGLESGERVLLQGRVDYALEEERMY